MEQMILHLLGTKDGDDTNNTRIVLSGYQCSPPYEDFAGTIEYRATSETGAQTFWLNDATAVVDIDNTDFTVYNSIGYIIILQMDNILHIHQKLIHQEDLGLVYFITDEYFFYSIVNIAVSNTSPTYTY